MMPEDDLSASAPRIFDFEALALRRARSRRLLMNVCGKSDFIIEYASSDILERLDFIRRPFRRAIVLGKAHDGFVEALGNRIGGIDRVEQIDPFDIAPKVDMVANLVQQLSPRGVAADLVVSPATLHLADDLPGVLAVIRRAMVPDGLLIANLLGGRTLEELRSSLIEAETNITGGASARVHPMADVRSLGGLLQRAGFALPVTDSDVVDVSYASPLNLMNDLRRLGLTNVLSDRPRRFLSRLVLAEADAIYRDRFGDGSGRIRATFEIVSATGWVPHDSQQKPLRPGSASMRLSDALKSDGDKSG